MVWYSHLFKNVPQLVVIHTVKGFHVVSEAEVVVLLEFPFLLYDPTNIEIWSLVLQRFRNAVCTSGSSRFVHC